MDFVTQYLTPEPPNLLISLVDERDFIKYSYRPDQYFVDHQCPGEGMEECQDPSRSECDEITGRGVYGTGSEGDGILGTE